MMCWSNDGDYWGLRDGQRKARKQHRCEAGCRIEPGDQYHFWVGIWEGDLTEGKACDPCWKAASALGHACRLYESQSDDPPIYELRDAYHEHLECGELPLDVVPADVVAGLRQHYAALRERLGCQHSEGAE